MKIKTVILLVIATVADKSLATESSKSCEPPTNIRADLAVVQFGEDTAHHGLQRSVEIIFTEIKSTLNRRAQGIHEKTKYEESRTAIARNETITALEVGIIPTVEAVRTIQPAVDVESDRDRAYRQLERIGDNFFCAIELTQGKNTSKILSKIKAIDDDTQDAGRTLITQLFTSISNGSVKIPANADATMECIQTRVTSQILGALSSVVDGIRLLVDSRCTGKKAGSDDCLSAIQATQDKVSGLFESEVTIKFSAIRNILIDQLLQKIGIVPGLFAVQTAQAAASG